MRVSKLSQNWRTRKIDPRRIYSPNLFHSVEGFFRTEFIQQALKDADRLERCVGSIAATLSSAGDDLDLDAVTKEVNSLNEEISQHVLPYFRKDAMRTQLQSLKKQMLDVDKARKAKVANDAVDSAKTFLTENPGRCFWVEQFDVGSNAKALDSVLKQVKALSPKTAAMVFSADLPGGKILCLAVVPPVSHE